MLHGRWDRSTLPVPAGRCAVPRRAGGVRTRVTDVSTALGTDFVGIAAEFGEEERDYLRRTRAFVDDEVLPVINGFWERAEFPADLVHRMGELGLVSDASTTRAYPR